MSDSGSYTGQPGSLFPEFEAECVPLRDPPPPRPPLWQVLAVDRWGEWGQPKKAKGVFFKSREKALAVAREAVASGYWREARIFGLPSEGQQEIQP